VYIFDTDKEINENLKKKLYKCNACIYFNRQCLIKKLTPSYARIKIPTPPQHTNTHSKKVTTMRIKDEIKFLHCKKQKLNLSIYHLHLNLTKSWGSLWPHMQQTIETKLQKECRAKYQTLNNKLERLSLHQTKNPPTNPRNFHLRVINMIDISFTEPEMALPQKGPKYNLHDKPKNWIRNPAL